MAGFWAHLVWKICLKKGGLCVFVTIAFGLSLVLDMTGIRGIPHMVFVKSPNLCRKYTSSFMVHFPASYVSLLECTPQKSNIDTKKSWVFKNVSPFKCMAILGLHVNFRRGCIFPPIFSLVSTMFHLPQPSQRFLLHLLGPSHDVRALQVRTKNEALTNCGSAGPLICLEDHLISVQEGGLPSYKVGK